MGKISSKRSKGEGRKNPVKRAKRSKKGNRRVNDSFSRVDLRVLTKDSPEYWQEILRRHGERLGRGKPNGQTLAYGWN